MRAELKGIHSPDIDFNTFWPEEADNFGFLLQAMIGSEGQIWRLLDEKSESAEGFCGYCIFA